MSDSSIDVKDLFKQEKPKRKVEYTQLIAIIVACAAGGVALVALAQPQLVAALFQ